ncbi:MAG: hypothetical protein ACLFWD_10395 [Anaerolineales bacterium]
MASKARIPTTEEALAFAVNSIQRAEIETGKAALRWVLRREPENVSAWLWLKKCVEQDQLKQQEVVQRITSLNPMIIKN